MKIGSAGFLKLASDRGGERARVYFVDPNVNTFRSKTKIEGLQQRGESGTKRKAAVCVDKSTAATAARW